MTHMLPRDGANYWVSLQNLGSRDWPRGTVFNRVALCSPRTHAIVFPTVHEWRKFCSRIFLFYAHWSMNGSHIQQERARNGKGCRLLISRQSSLDSWLPLIYLLSKGGKSSRCLTYWIFNTSPIGQSFSPPAPLKIPFGWPFFFFFFFLVTHSQSLFLSPKYFLLKES